MGKNGYTFEKKSPVRRWTEQVMRRPPGLSKREMKQSGIDGRPVYVRATQNEYPRLHQAVEEVAALFQIDVPAAYIQTDNRVLAMADPAKESIWLAEDIYDALSDSELKAVVAHEMKHIYHPLVIRSSAKKQLEFDADQAAVAATDPQTVINVLHKIERVMVRRIPDKQERDELDATMDANPDGELVYNDELAHFLQRYLHPTKAERITAVLASGRDFGGTTR